MFRCVLLLFAQYAVGRRSRKPEGVFFKLADGDKFIGHDSGSKELKLVDYSHAVRFKLEDLENQAEKRLKTVDDKEAFTERGWWFFRKWFEIDAKGSESKQGFNIVYSGPDVYVLMRDGSCLTSESGIFRKEYCTNKNIPKFRMCKDKKCHGSSDKMARDLKFIKCAIAHTIYEGHAQSFGPGGSAGSPRHMDDFDDGPRGEHGRRHHGRGGYGPHHGSREYQDTSSESDDYDSSDWSGQAFDRILGIHSPTLHDRGGRHTGMPRRRRAYDDRSSEGSRDSDYGSSESSDLDPRDCKSFNKFMYDRHFMKRYYRGGC